VYYILDADNNPIPEPNALDWAIWFEDNHSRRVGWTQITSEIVVSTVFLGLDHNFSGQGGPILFETMVFGGKCDEYQCRHHTWAEAAAFHAMVVEELRAIYVKGVTIENGDA
jgi:hypothetical protein